MRKNLTKSSRLRVPYARRMGKGEEMAENKTQRNDGDVTAYLDSVENKRRRDDALVLLELMGEISGEPAQLWGTEHRRLRHVSLQI